MGDDSRRSTPVSAVHILLPVWGYKYIQQMLEFCIPSLLASGNIPAVASIVETKFVLLTRAADASLISDHPSWIELSKVCEVEIRPIDDLITRDNHTAVITLAFHRAIREAGPARNDICFVLMNSDFLVANNAIKNVVDKINHGSSAILAGNFQIIAEEAAPILRTRVDRRARSLELSSRELLSFAYSHLHPATVANIVNLGVGHNSSANRLFWRVNADTLLGRFFLIHVVAIRPENIDEAPLSSYDYSFIPEMCPSGNIHHVQDSDEYVVVEMQPISHEASHLRPGPLTAESLAASLAEWTTAQHRANSSKPIYFHAKDVPPAGGISGQADRFIAETMDSLKTPPISYKNHPYWQGSIVAHQERTGEAMTRRKWASLFPPSLSRHKRIFGAPPEVSILHPIWLKYSVISQYLRNRKNARGLFVCHDPVVFHQWLSGQEEIFSFQAETLTSLTRNQYLPLVGSFDFAILFLCGPTFRLGRSAIARIAPTLVKNGKLFVFIDGSAEVAALTTLLDIRLKVSAVHYQADSAALRRLRTLIDRLMDQRRNPFYLLFGIVPAVVAVAVLNFLLSRRAGKPGNTAPTGATIELSRSDLDDDVALPYDLDGLVKNINPGMDGAAALVVAASHCLPADGEVKAVRNLIEASELVSKCLIDRGGA